MNAQPIQQVAQECQADMVLYRRTGRSDGRACLQLFRMALHENDQDAWTAIVTQYQGYVANLIRGRYRSQLSEEDIQEFVNDAFSRMWQSITHAKGPKSFDTLGACLAYLKLCTWSVVNDHLRKTRVEAHSRDEDITRYELFLWEGDRTSHDILVEMVWQKLLGSVENEQEAIVAEASWLYGMPPREIYEEHEKAFTSTPQVSAIKKRILTRLKTWLEQEISDFLEMLTDGHERIVVHERWLNGLSWEEIHAKHSDLTGHPDLTNAPANLTRIVRRNSRRFREWLNHLRYDYSEIAESEQEAVVAKELWTNLSVPKSIQMQHPNLFKNQKEITNIRNALVQKARIWLADQNCTQQ